MDPAGINRLMNEDIDSPRANLIRFSEKRVSPDIATDLEDSPASRAL
jgi:hypothetical protein